MFVFTILVKNEYWMDEEHTITVDTEEWSEALDEVNETAYRLAGHTPFYSIESVSMKGEQ